LGFPETFKALSDPVRREILVILKGGRMSAGDIAGHFDIIYHNSKKPGSSLKRSIRISFIMN